MPVHERCVVLLDQYPWSIGTRIGLGFITAYVLRQLCDNGQQVWYVIGSFLAILFLLRLGPAMVRRLVPFSKEAHLTWWERRQLAKRFDSYQWQKLFWMGIGMAGYAMLGRNVGNAIGVLVALCLLGGGLGALLWVRRNERTRA
ncbi:MAG TPA: hypothetical protein DDY39_02595 [Nitrospira sp.]|nr:hypothetical protein [Nitrospira sp.]